MDPHSLSLLEYDKVKAMLAGYAASSLGKAEAARLAPMTDPERIRRAIAETAELRELLERRGRLPMAGMTDLRPLIAATGDAEKPLEPQNLLELKDTLLASRHLRQLFEQEAQSCPHLADLGQRLEDFEELCFLVEHTVERDGTVRDDASPQLADIRQRLASALAALRERAYTIAARPAIKPLLQSEAVTIRRGRYVLAIKAEHRHELDGIIHDRSQTGATVYVEPRDLVLLGNEVDDVRFEERREVERLLWRITLAVRDQRQSILATLDALARLDLTYAKARFSAEFAMAPPEVRHPGHMLVHNARHPILVRVLERDPSASGHHRVVPISYRLGDDFDLLVITGPNTGGKTVALKTIGLLALMAQSGMHVPADPGAAFPVYTNVLADIGDEQSIEQNLSTFSSHMRQIIRILGKAHRRTLVLLDELGSGTDPTEGAGLGTAVLDYLRSRRAHTVVTTHIGELKAYAFRRRRAMNAACEFDDETLRPTYRLLIGQPGNSNALAIAQRLGLPHHIIRRARSILRKTRGAGARLIDELTRTRRQAEDDREKARALRQEAQELKDRTERELRAARAIARASRREAEEELDQQLRALRARLLEALRRLYNAPAPFADRAREVAEVLEAQIQHTPLAAKRERFASRLKKGDLVYVVPFGEKCRVRSVSKKRRRIEVAFGHNVVEVSFEDISWVAPPADVTE